MKLFTYTIEVYKQDTPESIRRKKIKDFRLNATKGLIDAELQLLLNKEQLKQADKEDKEKLKESIVFQKKSIKNYKAQLSVLNKQ